MIYINNYISEIQNSIISYISSQKLPEKTFITSQFNKIKTSISSPVISLCFDKISILQNSLKSGISDSYLNSYKINFDLSFSIYVPIKLGANLCYDIFYDLSNKLLNNNININFLSISCDNIEIQKQVNCFMLKTHAKTYIIPC